MSKYRIMAAVLRFSAQARKLVVRCGAACVSLEKRGDVMRILRAVMVWMGVAAMATTAGAQGQTHKGYEAPPYVVERVAGDVEIRRYAPHIVAEVTVEGDRDSAISGGFRVLAGYIFGGNESDAKVAMTVPVAQTPAAGAGDGQSWVVRFMMPAAYTLDTLPKPTDARIRLVRQPAQRQAAVQFSGLRTSAVLDRQTETLRAAVAQAGLSVVSGPHYYFYDGPMTLPWNRRNEVAFTVE